MKVLDGGSSSKPLAVVRVGGATAAAAGIVSLMGGGGSSSISALSSSSSSKRKSFGGVSGEVKLVPLMRDGRGYFALASPYKVSLDLNLTPPPPFIVY